MILPPVHERQAKPDVVSRHQCMTGRETTGSMTHLIVAEPNSKGHVTVVAILLVGALDCVGSLRVGTQGQAFAARESILFVSMHICMHGYMYLCVCVCECV
jgi:hypothetical protein